ncbi:low affinity potassium transporter [Pleurotus ostreatus]|uniref:Low affinity potassium transporter n=1 Tax=Pleurotus ostreatus TaxID=5322 RepID=A0A8H7A5G3_PLEOS|nr:low affinity potassium transporter [Pleurotus ostreatus]KAF7440982.1 low affinity potassium transporter [Pleurotus ostreatus]
MGAPSLVGAWDYVQRNLNFFRIHLIIFTITPLLSSLILYLSNGENRISYIDALFNCVSAMSVCGLATIDLSSLTPWQQVILFLQIRYFVKKFQHIIKAASVNSQIRRANLPRQRTHSYIPWPLSLFRDRKNKPIVVAPPDPMVKLDAPPKRPGILTKSQQIAQAHSARPSSLRSRRLSDPGVFPSIHGIHLCSATVEHYAESMIDTLQRAETHAKDTHFGGFPSPFVLLQRLITYLRQRYASPRSLPTLSSSAINSNNLKFDDFMPPLPPIDDKGAFKLGDPPSAPVSYVSFPPIIGRNSMFHLLTEEQLEELGGVEYRALTALLWIIAFYHIGVQLVAFIMMAPYMSIGQFSSSFVPPQLHKRVSPTWFSLFLSASAYTNTGFSLVDQSMVPFQRAYLTVIVVIFLILAGNTAFPIFLRFSIWCLSQTVPAGSQTHETMRFLLDHPRRCYIYLFPSHQTWFLLTIVVSLTITDWVFFLVLDIGNGAISSIPVGTRILVGALQAVSVRAAGFAAVSLLALAPAVKVLYLIMMYVSLSIRATNVYEEQSLGIFEGEEDGEFHFQPVGSRATVWSQYLSLHARRLLAFDMWWLAFALFLLCIIERANLNDENAPWFNTFTLMFDLVSAYGSVGMSLGIPTENYSLSGALRPLSKLIVCIVMLRGRHRSLPVAIDRAIMLPAEFERHHVDEKGGMSGFSPRSPLVAIVILGREAGSWAQQR